MFGGTSSNSNSPAPKDSHESPPSPQTPKSNAGVGSIPNGLDLDSNTDETSEGSSARSQSLSIPHSAQDGGQPQTGEKKRRSSGIAKAGALFANAKQSLHLSSSNAANSNSSPDSPLPQSSAIQKLGKTDPALSVPQGSLNNSAGESNPGPRSTFRVGVAEDKNKKCRRTMEDTHAYLYNFLSTPAPKLGTKGDNDSKSERKGEDAQSRASTEHVVETDNGYFAIFDGHAGTFAADWCGKKLHILLEDIIRRHPNTPIPELLDQTFTSVDQQLDKLPLKNSGCTAICAVLRWEDRIPSSQSATGSTNIAPAAAAAVKAAASEASSTTDKKSDEQAAPSPTTPTASVKSSGPTSAPSTLSPLPKLQSAATRQRVLYTANVGDARIVLCRNGKALRLSYDHKGSDENEGKRISNAGGLILNNRVNGVLAVTRALGDSYMKDLVTGHPYTTETVIQPDIDEFLILACDGLWDVCSDQEAVDLVRPVPDAQAASKLLVEHALSRFSTDNLSCMIVRFDAKAVLQNLHPTGNLTPIGVEGDAPSREKGGVSEADHLVAEARKSLGPDAVTVDATASPIAAAQATAEQTQDGNRSSGEAVKDDVITEMREEANAAAASKGQKEEEEEEAESGPEVDMDAARKVSDQHDKDNKEEEEEEGSGTGPGKASGSASD